MYRLFWNQVSDGKKRYYGKHGSRDTTLDSKRARIFQNKSALVNHLMRRWPDIPEDVVVEEVEVKPTGKTYCPRDLLVPLLAEHARQELQRKQATELEATAAELRELHRLQAKYGVNHG